MLAILANGAFPQNPAVLERLRAAERLVCCDGALGTALANGLTPCAVVGDGDSIPPALREEYAAIWHRDPSQDDNDLAKAIRFVLAEAPDSTGFTESVQKQQNDSVNPCSDSVNPVKSLPNVRIGLFGAAGKREDHFLGNLFHLLDFAQAGADCTLFTDTGVFFPVLPPGRSFECPAGTPVSVFAPDPATEMESDGLEWPLADVKFDTLWRGTLNRATAPAVTLRTTRPAIVYHEHP